MKNRRGNDVRSSGGETANPEWESVGRRIVSIRGELTQPEMAKLLGVSKTTYGRLERGVREAGADVLTRLAVMGWSPMWVLTGEGSERISAGANPSHAADTAVIVSGLPGDPRVKAAEARRSWAIRDLSNANAPAETAPDSQSLALRRDDLMLALQLAEEALEGKMLPSDKRAELVTLIYELLEEGLPEAKVLRFARAAAA